MRGRHACSTSVSSFCFTSAGLLLIFFSFYSFEQELSGEEQQKVILDYKYSNEEEQCDKEEERLRKEKEVKQLKEQIKELNNTMELEMQSLMHRLGDLNTKFTNSGWETDRNLVSRTSGEVTDNAINVVWSLSTAFLIFFMQAGFGMLEAGTVHPAFVKELLLQKLLGSAVSAIAFWFFGYGIAFADNGDHDNMFIGTSNFFLSEGPTVSYGSRLFLFQWVFASNTASIVSGAVAERSKLTGYIIITFFLAALVHPFAAHWVWSESGFMSANNRHYRFLDTLGFIDFGGGCLVHSIGGIFGLVGAIIAGKRTAEETDRNRDISIQSLGVFILWFGWYGFNCGSVRDIVGRSHVVGNVSVNMTLAAASAAIAAFLWSICKDLLSKLWKRYCRLKKLETTLFLQTFSETEAMAEVLNGILAGLVSITGCAGEIEYWAAFLVGFSSYFVYSISSTVCKMCGVDDPLDAFSVHTACGLWGVLVGVGLFATKDALHDTYGPLRGYDFDDYGLFMGGGGKLLGVQIIGVLIIISWSTLWAILIFVFLKETKMLLRDNTSESSTKWIAEVTVQDPVEQTNDSLNKFTSSMLDESSTRDVEDSLDETDLTNSY